MVLAAFVRFAAQLKAKVPSQCAALQHYAHGRNWRADLAEAWGFGKDSLEPDGEELRQVRNQFGPS